MDKTQNVINVEQIALIVIYCRNLLILIQHLLYIVLDYFLCDLKCDYP